LRKKKYLAQKSDMYVTLRVVVKNWVARFRTGHLSSEEEGSVRQSQVTVLENMDAIHSMIVEVARISAKKTIQQRPWRYPEKEQTTLFKRF
jgi:hypothetical protein